MKVKTLFVASLLTLPLLTACVQKGHISFAKDSYQIHSGDKVEVKQNYSNVSYSIEGNKPASLSVNSKSGVITFGDDVNNYSQFIYKAAFEKWSCSTVITLLRSDPVPELEFVSPTNYICDGDLVLAKSSNDKLSITYSITSNNSGVSIDSSSGRVSYTAAATDGEEFTVKISSNGANETHTFIVAKSNLAKVNDVNQVIEKNGSPAAFELDFSKVSPSFNRTVIGISKGNSILDNSYYTYDSTRQVLVINSSINEILIPGENELSIITPRNNIKVNVISATKLIRTPEDLASINSSRSALQGYYILANNIDLTDYLSKGHAGYNDGKGWAPIGVYHDVTDGTAMYDIFNGTFDGNGYTISGLYFNRSTSEETSFNCGLFGYAGNLSIIKNLGVVGADETCFGKSYIGGFIGVNEGTISNCWADVDISNNYEGLDHKMCGGFVGRNIGTIENCYSLGKVDGELNFGAFIGKNDKGVIKNCFANKESCDQYSGDYIDPEIEAYCFFETLNLMKAHDYSDDFSSEYWDLSKSLPELKTHLHSFYVDRIVFDPIKAEYTKGDTIHFNYHIIPYELESQYIDQVEVTVNDPHSTAYQFSVVTTEDSLNDIEITLSLEIDGILIQAKTSVHLFDKPTEIVFSEDLPQYVEPGKRYRLNSSVNPDTASQQVVWSLKPTKVPGVSIEDNILTVGELVQKYRNETFTIKAKTLSNNITFEKVLTLNQPKYLDNGYTLFKDDTNDLVIEMPNEEDLTNAQVYRYNKATSFSVSEHTITIPRSVLTEIPDTTITFNIRLANGTYYRVYGTYISHDRITSVEGEVIHLSSKEDFYQYFNQKDFDENRFANYDKVFVLDNDIDFENETLYGIGFADDEKHIEHQFTGKIYGMGHKIKNARVGESERYFALTPEEREEDPTHYKYRSSRFVVGFFGKFNGQIYDVVFENINVIGRNYCGVFAGTCGPNSRIENVIFNGCSVQNAYEVDYTVTEGISVIRTGDVTARTEGVIVATTFNGEIYNLEG